MALLYVSTGHNGEAKDTLHRLLRLKAHKGLDSVQEVEAGVYVLRGPETAFSGIHEHLEGLLINGFVVTEGSTK